MFCPQWLKLPMQGKPDQVMTAKQKGKAALSFLPRWTQRPQSLQTPLQEEVLGTFHPPSKFTKGRAASDMHLLGYQSRVMGRRKISHAGLQAGALPGSGSEQQCGSPDRFSPNPQQFKM